MAQNPDHISMALFCDFENVALGVRDANYDKFDIKRVLEKLLLKGSIVVKKAYCDWERYKGFKATMHEANFELIEIPHVRQSGKNSADIRMVVDALDLCYTKAHVNTFVIISGDSDFSPLVSKLRENNKQVIGVGVKQSTSDLLIANCDEFIFYDDLVRDSQRRQARSTDARGEGKEAREAAAPRRSPEEERKRKEEMNARRAKAIDIAYNTFDALMSERGDGGKIWASVLKEAIKRRNPGFNENYFGFRTFGNLLEEAQAKGLMAFGRDEKSGAYVFRPAADGMPLAEPLAEPMSEPMGELRNEQDVDATALRQTHGMDAGMGDHGDEVTHPSHWHEAPVSEDAGRRRPGGRGGSRGGRSRSGGGRGEQGNPGGQGPQEDGNKAPGEQRAQRPAPQATPAPAPAPTSTAARAPEAPPATAAEGKTDRTSRSRTKAVKTETEAATDTGASAKRPARKRAPVAKRAPKADNTDN